MLVKIEKLMITAAITGSITTREKNPHPPMTPKEIADSAIESYKAGATTCHIHVRDPLTHQPSMKFELYKEVFDRIRDKCDMVINLTTGAGARILLDPKAADPWDLSGLKLADERVEHILKLKPDLCSLDVGTLNFGPRGFLNIVSEVEKMAKAIKEVGTKPELEVFDLGHIRIAKHLPLSPGKAADLVIFDPLTIEDKATYDQPRQYPIGINYVFVNGIPVVWAGDHTRAFPGQAL